MQRVTHFFACFCLVAVAGAQQPPMSMQLLDASGKAIGEAPERVPVKITGRVLDADTRQPLPAFYVTSGTQDREHTGFDWSATNRMLFTRGAFAVTVTRERLAPAVLIEAEGYLPRRAGPIRGRETNLTFLLQKGQGPTGVVLTPDGRPAAGRTVYFSRLKDLLYLEGSNLKPRKASSRLLSMVADDAGRFSFAPDLDGYSIVVADDAGFADVRIEDLKSAPEVRLHPWGRVEGTLKIGAQLAANQTVRMADAFAPYAYYPRPLPPFAISVETTTDAAGRFVFPRVPPADVKVFYSPKAGRAETGLTPMTQITNFTVKAGERRNVTLGGQGNLVVGRVVLKNYTKPVHWQDEVFWMDSVSSEPSNCPNFDAISKEYHAAIAAATTPDEKLAAQDHYLAEQDKIARQLRDYYSSPAGRNYWFAKSRYVLIFSPDGSFYVNDVPAGKYELNIDLRELVNKRGQLKSPIIAVHRQEVEVAGSSNGRCGETNNLGVITMLARLNPGDMAPDFSVKTLDDKSVKLSDYKGKNVLLVFWAAADSRSVAETPALKETYAAFKNDPRFAMLGLSLDPDIATARAYSVKNQLEWTQGWLGPRSESDVPDRYGLENIPFVIMIGPEGSVLVSGLSGGTIESTVETILAGPPK